MIGISGYLIWPKSLIHTVVNFSEVRSQIHSPHLYVRAPEIFSYLSRSVQMRKREWGVESNRKLPNLIIHGKTAALVPKFAKEDLPSAELEPWFLRL